MTEENPAMRPQASTARTPRHHHRLEYRLDCGRTVHVEEFRIALSMLGYFAGSGDIRAEIINQMPTTVMDQFPGCDALLIKPVPEGDLPAFIFMVALVSQPVDPASDSSCLVVCWLCDDIETSLPELIDREVRTVEWDKHAVDDNF